MTKKIPIAFDKNTSILDIAGNQTNMNLCDWALHMPIVFNTFINSKLLVMSSHRTNNIQWNDGGGLRRHFSIFDQNGNPIIPINCGMGIKQIRDIDHGYGFEIYHYNDSGTKSFYTNIWEKDFANISSASFYAHERLVPELPSRYNEIAYFKPIIKDTKNNYHNCNILWNMENNTQFNEMQEKLCEPVIKKSKHSNHEGDGFITECKVMGSSFKLACRVCAKKIKDNTK